MVSPIILAITIIDLSCYVSGSPSTLNNDHVLATTRGTGTTKRSAVIKLFFGKGKVLCDDNS